MNKKGEYLYSFNEGGTKGIVFVMGRFETCGRFIYVAIGYKSKWLRWHKWY